MDKAGIMQRDRIKGAGERLSEVAGDMKSGNEDCVLGELDRVERTIQNIRWEIMEEGGLK